MPLATLTILLPPLFKPSPVNLTAVLPSPRLVGVMVMPPLSTLVSPIVNEPALVKLISLFKAKVNTPLVRLTCKFLPALNVSSLPALTALPSSFLVSAKSSSELSAFANHFAELIMSATLLTLVTLSPSPDFA